MSVDEEGVRGRDAKTEGTDGSQGENCMRNSCCIQMVSSLSLFLFSSLIFRFPYDVSDTLLTLVMSCSFESLTGSNFGFTRTLLQTEVSFPRVVNPRDNETLQFMKEEREKTWKRDT